MSTRAEYLADGHQSVEGWFHPLDRLLFVALSDLQRAGGAHGDVLEIGAYKGKSAILLGYLLGEAERLVVNDLFDGTATSADSAAENAMHYGGLTLSDFQANYRRFHPTLPEVVLGPSTLLAGACDLGTFRFLHVDGSHVYDDVIADLLLTKELAIGSDAVVAIDDIRSSHTPGVWAAAWECVYEHGLIPFAVSEAKMYATWGRPGIDLSGDLRRRLQREAGVATQLARIRAAEILCVGSAPPPPMSRRGKVAMDWIPPKLRRMLL